MKTFEKETFKESFIKVKLLGKASAKAQSAMEYLMTYGWAILIIAVVLGAFFELGVFNANNFAPKAPPGSCQVFRPNGPGTTSFINLEGICTGEIPQYVAQFGGAAGSSYILTSEGYSAPNALTMAGWFISTSFQNNYQFPIDSNPEAYWRIGFNSANQIYFDPGSHNDQVISTTIKFNRWYFAAFTTQDSGSNTIWNFYLDGSLVASGSVGQNIQSVSAIGLGDYAYYFVGQLSNVQVYNTSLSANDIQALYLEGIGGAPINLQHLVGWWPLNGNANDYSGNGNNGVPTNVIFVSNWYSSYTPP